MSDNKVSVDLLFETSWEVCNKVGGIYTVLSTKAHTLQQLYKDKTIFIGPDVWSEDNPSPFFKESATLLRPWREKALLPEGVSVRVGRWTVPGNPIAILVKFDAMYACKDGLYARMWELYGVDSLHAYGDYDEACAFSHAAALVIKSIYDYKRLYGKRVIAHFDEWTTGMGLLLTKHLMPEVATIFTTHATSIGRSICGNNKPLYDYMKGYNGDQMAGELNMQSKHSLEKAAAHAADCFTTVSDITAIECEQLLELRPHVVTPNGFEKNFVPAPSKFAGARRDARRLMADIVSRLIGKYIDADKTFFVATSGRCEYRNKGLDVYLDSLYHLRRLVNTTDKSVVAFVMVPSWVDKPRYDLIEAIECGKSGRLDNPVLTHTVNEAWNNQILNQINRLGFANRDGDNMTVVYVPCYLNGNDGIFNHAYYDLLIGMDATVFPSYYEPWGYTPLESIAFGVPTVTTSLSGFGQWILSTGANGFKVGGVEVVNRNDSNYPVVVENITKALYDLIASPDDVRKEISSAAEQTADKAAWQYFITYYIEAFDIALGRAAKRGRLC